METIKKFIILHDADDNTPIIVNTEIINYVQYHSYGDERYAEINFVNDNDSICVKESIEKIYALMLEKSTK